MFSSLWGNEIEGFLWALNTSGQASESRYYPTKEAATYTVSQTQGPLPELKALVRERLNGELHKYLLNPNLFLLGSIGWEKENIVNSFSIQTFLCTETSLDYAVNSTSGDIPVEYYRYDCHPNRLGLIFREPFTHVHSSVKNDPRFSFLGEGCSNMVLNFIEFIYRTHFYEQWIDWVEEICLDNDIVDEFLEVQNLFKFSNYAVLTNKQQELIKIKTLINAKKESCFPWRLNHNSVLFTY